MRILSTILWRYYSTFYNMRVFNMNRKMRKIISTIIILIIVLSMVVPVVLSAIMY